MSKHVMLVMKSVKQQLFPLIKYLILTWKKDVQFDLFQKHTQFYAILFRTVQENKPKQFYYLTIMTLDHNLTLRK